MVREFVYDESALLAGKNEIAKLESDKKKQHVSGSLLHKLEGREFTVTPKIEADAGSGNGSFLATLFVLWIVLLQEG